jgi:cytochrome c oxidase cbb3-type subunit 1
MDWFVKAFIKSSLCWLGVGVIMGVSMAFIPSFIAYRPAHVHANLLGFVTMMIYGIGYFVLPRFFSQKLHNKTLAGVHVWVANIGLAGMFFGFITRWMVLLGGGAVLSAAGAFMFIYNIWRTIDAPALIRRQNDYSRYPHQRSDSAVS